MEHVVAGIVGSQQLRSELHRRLEDGSPNFQAICAAVQGLRTLQSDFLSTSSFGGNGSSMRFAIISASTVEARLNALRCTALSRLESLRHQSNGTPVVLVHAMHSAPFKAMFPRTTDGDRDGRFFSQGPTIAFTVLEDDGRPIGHTLVERLLAADNVLIRAGCFCNPGACEYFLGIGEERVAAHARAGHKCWDDNDLVDGRPTGCCRASLGLYSNLDDVERLVSSLRRAFARTGAPPQRTMVKPLEEPRTCAEDGGRDRVAVVKHIAVYPIKGCAGFFPLEWPVVPSGLYADRTWMIIDAFSMKPIIPKVNKKLSLIRVLMDVRENVMIVTRAYSSVGAPLLQTDCSMRQRGIDSSSSIVIVLDEGRPAAIAGHTTVMCGDIAPGKREGHGALHVRSKEIAGFCGYSSTVDDWFSSVLGTSARLVRVQPEKESDESSFNNTGHLLVVHEASHQRVLREIRQRGERADHVNIHSYRANIIVTSVVGITSSDNKSDSPFVEHQWHCLRLPFFDHAVGENDARNQAGQSERGIKLVSTGPCHRCQQVGVDARVGADSGAIRQEPLASIAILCRRQQHHTNESSSSSNRSNEIIFGQMFNVANVGISLGLEAAAGPYPTAVAGDQEKEVGLWRSFGRPWINVGAAGSSVLISLMGQHWPLVASAGFAVKVAVVGALVARWCFAQQTPPPPPVPSSLGTLRVGAAVTVVC